jgi:hypothetical protein
MLSRCLPGRVWGRGPCRNGFWTAAENPAGTIRIEPHRNDEVDVLVVVVLGRGELTLDGQVHQLVPMVIARLPKGTVRAVGAVDGPLAYLSIHRRRSAGLQLGRHAQRR